MSQENKPNLLLMGGSGQLGQDIKRVFENDFNICAPKSTNVCIEKKMEIYPNIVLPLIINCAAYTNVDKAEIEMEKANNVNAIGALNIAALAKEIGAYLVHFSTDYVFGEKVNLDSVDFSRKFVETDIAPKKICNFYGITKYIGEQYINHIYPERSLIICTSGLYGKHKCRGKGGNFVDKIIELAKKERRLDVSAASVSPTYTLDLAQKTLELVKSQKVGVFHLFNSGFCTWDIFARAIVKSLNLNVEIKAIFNNEKKEGKAYRSLNTSLGTVYDFCRMRTWVEALESYLNDK